MDVTALVNAGVENAKAAITADEEQRYEKAYMLYKDAVDDLLSAQARLSAPVPPIQALYERGRNAKISSLIDARVAEYTQRMELLKAHLDAKNGPGWLAEWEERHAEEAEWEKIRKWQEKQARIGDALARATYWAAAAILVASHYVLVDSLERVCLLYDSLSRVRP